MKGHMEDGKFHPHTTKKGVRKSRDQKAKTQGIRLQREDPFIEQKMKWKQMLKDHREGKISGIDVLQYYYSVPFKAKKLYGLPNKAPKLRAVRNAKDEFNLPLKQRKVIAKELSDFDFVILDQNPRWKLTHIVVDDGSEFYVFPDEESALEFGVQSIRDTATDYIPDEGSENYEEWKDLEGEDLVDKIIEELSEFGQRSELGAVAQAVASADGQYTELSDGTIAFQIS